VAIGVSEKEYRNVIAERAKSREDGVDRLLQEFKKELFAQ